MENNEHLCVSVWPSRVFSGDNPSPPHITHTNHIIMATSGQFYPCSDYCKIKENVNIMLLDLCLCTFYLAHVNKFTWHWLYADLISS